MNAVEITGSFLSCEITVVSVNPVLLTDSSGAVWEVYRFTCCNNGNYWSGEGCKVRKDGKVGGTYSRSIDLAVPEHVKAEAVQYFV
jgi:hypothetical protein